MVSSRLFVDPGAGVERETMPGKYDHKGVNDAIRPGPHPESRPRPCNNTECGVCDEQAARRPRMAWGVGSPETALERAALGLPAGSLYIDLGTNEVHVFDGMSWKTALAGNTEVAQLESFASGRYALDLETTGLDNRGFYMALVPTQHAECCALSPGLEETMAATLAKALGEQMPDLGISVAENTVTMTSAIGERLEIATSCMPSEPPLIDVKRSIARPDTIIPRKAGETWGDFAKRVDHGPPGADAELWLQRLRVLAGEMV